MFSPEDIYNIVANKIDYPYVLKKENKIESPITKEKSFCIKITLRDKQKFIIKNNNKISLSIAVFSSEKHPKWLNKTKNGNDILIGQKETDLYNGEAYFDKIKLNEVTSILPNGWVYLIIFAKPHSFIKLYENSVYSYQDIRPMIIKNIVVKAKQKKKFN